MSLKTTIPKEMPLIPLKKTLVFPQAILSIYINSESSKKAILKSSSEHRFIFTSSLKDPDKSSTKVYDIGCVSLIMRMREMGDGRLKVLVQGIARAKLKELVKESQNAQVELLKEKEMTSKDEPLFQEIKHLLKQVAQSEGLFSPDFLLILEEIKSPTQVCDFILSNLNLKISDLQKGLETLDTKSRLELTKKFLQRELEVSQLQGRIQKLIKNQLPKASSTKSAGSLSGNLFSSKKEDIMEYSSKIKEKKLPVDIEKELNKQLSRLDKMHSESSEASMIRSYLECALELPWSHSSSDNLDLKNAEQILNKDHYGLEKAKERILEFLAVKTLNPKDLQAPILCFSGPPGVGKTSLGKSIAKAMERKYSQISLGGIKDEAEIRGHRRTYVGAMPGKIIQALNFCGTNNPVILLDEIDKLCSDFRGDPSSALLEVLDPEQNHSFKDHYLNLKFDLSKVLFIATANIVHNIPPALKDRLEVINISGYTQSEKTTISKNYLIEKELEKHGLPENHIHFTKEGLKTLINFYTQEAGLRNLKREVGTICRKIAKKFVMGIKEKITVDKETVFDLLGTPHYLPEESLRESKVGIATGLAWTSVGGQILFVEAVPLKKKNGGLILTGKLGEVMQESAKAALSYVKLYCENLNINTSWFEENEIHIHLPGGAISKDGPSAGVTLATVLLSLVTKVPVKSQVAMTGEISLSGRVLPVGGIKEKVLAAFNHNIHEVILPRKNEKDLQEIPKEFKSKMKFVLVDHLNEVFKSSLILPSCLENKALVEKNIS